MIDTVYRNRGWLASVVTDFPIRPDKSHLHEEGSVEQKKA